MKKLFLILALMQAGSSCLFGQTLQWGRQYQNLPLAFNYSSGVATDNSGNVYVTGQSDSINGTDFTTVKYNSSGVRQWVRRYDGPINGYDDAKSVKTDGSVNIYVSGNSEGTDLTTDFAVIKYNSDGVQQWAARYNGPSGDIENLSNMVIDSLGNVYITGASYGDNVTLTDIATVKYNSAGVQQWVMRYDSGNEDFLPFIKVSAAGNVYVTGTSINDTTGQNYVTIKYNSAGVQQWVRTYNGIAGGDDSPVALDVDALDNVFVTGNTNASVSPDFATIKYNSAGTQQWVSFYNDSNDYAVSITADNLGNVYVTGTSIYYDSYTTVCVTLKYNSSGAQQWVKLYTTIPGSSNYPIKVLTDAPGNTYVALESYDDLTGNDIAVLKYNSAGTQQWISKYNYTGTSNDNTSDMTIDASGNIYISGNTFNYSNLNTYMTTVKFSQSAVSSLQLQFNGYIQGFYNSATNTMVSDTATVYLRSTVPPYNKVDSSKAVLSSSGAGTFSFSNAVNGTNYYIAFRHRNSIETWSSTGNAFVSGLLAYNFSSAANKAYGNNQKQIDDAPLSFGFYSGDINQDGFIDLTDVISAYNDGSNFVTGYAKSDVDGNNITDLTDVIITYNNSVNFITKITP